MRTLARRRALQAALSGAVALMFGRCGDARAQAGSGKPKMTKERAQYKDEPEGGIYMCMTCTLFLPPGDCKVVEGPVSPRGWCNAFDLAD